MALKDSWTWIRSVIWVVLPIAVISDHRLLLPAALILTSVIIVDQVRRVTSP